MKNLLKKFKTFYILLVIAIFLIIYLLQHPPIFLGIDYIAWHGDWHKLQCRFQALSCEPLSKFPMAYLLNSLILDLLPFKEKSLLIINSIFIISSLFIINSQNNNESILLRGVPYLIALIFTPLLPFYINSGALEIQFGVILGLFLISIYGYTVSKNNISFYGYLSFFAIPFYKDTNCVLVIFIVILIVYLSTISAKVNFFTHIKCNTKFIIKLTLILLVTIILIISYNWVRYDSILPIAYIVEAKETSPDIIVKVQYLFWNLFSPSGGYLIFWSAAYFSLWICLRFGGLVFTKPALIVSASLIIFYTFLLANWWSPFGWIGWGNRLFIPIGISSLMLLASTATQKKTAIAKINTKKQLKFLLLMALFIILLPSFLYIFVGYSKNRYQLMQNSMNWSTACKAVSKLVNVRDDSFKKSPLNIQCHFDRFIYNPLIKFNMNGIGFADYKRYNVRVGSDFEFIGLGWSGIESWGVWSDGRYAELRFIPLHPIKKVILELHPFVSGALNAQLVEASFNGKLVSREIIRNATLFEVPLDGSFDLNNFQEIRLEFPNAISPFQLGVSNDNRKLGIGLESVTFE